MIPVLCLALILACLVSAICLEERARARRGESLKPDPFWDRKESEE